MNLEVKKFKAPNPSRYMVSAICIPQSAMQSCTYGGGGCERIPVLIFESDNYTDYIRFDVYFVEWSDGEIEMMSKARFEEIRRG